MPARRWQRVTLKIFLGLVLLIVISATGLWTAVHLLAPEKIKTFVETSVSGLIGGKLTIDRIESAPFPQSELRAQGVHLADARGRVIFECPQVVARASLFSVLKMNLGIEEIRFENPEIRLWYERDGRLNVERLIDEINAKPPLGVGGAAPLILLNEITIAQGRLTLSDAEGAPAVIDGKVNGRLTLNFAPMGLRGLPFEFSVDGGDSGARVEATGALGVYPSLRLRAARVPARALSPRMKALATCSGRADLRLDWDGGSNPSFDFSVSPARLCTDVGVLPNRISGTVRRESSAWQVDLALNGQDTQLRAIGAVPPGVAPISFDVTGSSVSVEEVSSWGAALASMARPETALSKASARIIKSRVVVDRATFHGVNLTKASFDVNRGTNGVVWIERLDLQAFNGTLGGLAEIRDREIYVDLRGNDLALADIVSVFGSSSTPKGRMAIALTGHVPVGAPVISAFTGHAEVWVEEFEMQRVPAILKAITSASVVKLLDKIKGEKHQAFLPAKGNGQAALKDGVAEVRKLWLANRVLHLAYEGKVKYVAGELDGSLVVQTLTAAEQLIKNVPVVRDVVLDGGKSILPIWFRLEGPWADPKVRLQPIKSAEAPVMRILKGLIYLPQDIYDKVRGKK